METAKLFTNGRSQAVRLPKAFRFEGDDVYIKKFADLVILIPKDSPWSSLWQAIDTFTDDFMDDRAQPTMEQERLSL